MSSQDKSRGVRLVPVPADRDGQRLDNFLANQLPGVPRAAVYRLIRTGQVRVDGGRAKASRKLRTGEQVRIPPARTRERGEFSVPEAACSQLEAAILYEDESLLVVDKPAGMAVHSGSGLAWGLIDVMRRVRPDGAIELVHRLDRETSGCLVLARGGEALRQLSAQFRDGQVSKQYLCLLDGELEQASVEVDVPLAKIGGGEQSKVGVDEQGKPARTRFRLLRSLAGCSYAEVELFTGRTHQIRAHAQYLGMPLAGDERYADRDSLRRWRKRGLKRTFLHAHRLGLVTPAGEEAVFDAPLPEDLRRVLDLLEGSISSAG